ncbi:uncharacterized protein A4U43_C01F13110 [Asparagus officinalis]|uniref:Nin one binding (NOB1) Zn-ribbon-like domain-containing protein n=2 Tax=Asparagus officinalis TaxID=4686 RepID=A0A5P1FP83_ASPOF|nr:uncharacterized protein A4U43_C01F13110 [Asparagus officinalis]
MEPSPESIKKVVRFARETGDLQTLSDVDLKLIALTYMLETQIHGTNHLRDSPPPLHVLNVKSLPEAQMPGWGNNVPNLAEWEALEQLTEGGLSNESRLLPLKDLNGNIVPENGSLSEMRDQDEKDQAAGRTRRFTFPKKEIKLDGKKMVADGIDASLGEDTENNDDWRPAVSRSTHRRYLRRKARRELASASNEDGQPCEVMACGDTSVTETDDVLSEDGKCEDKPSANDDTEGNLEECCISSALEHMKLGQDVSEPTEEVKEQDITDVNIGSDHQLILDGTLDDLPVSPEADENDLNTEEFDNSEISSQTDGSIDTSAVDDASSEQSWMLRSLSDSSVACVTSDFAMQNVILQIGLRLLAPGGMQIRQLHRWVLKCHACNKVTQEIGRIFCPKCGNGGTLRKVSVTVGENGVLLAARRQRITLRGTKFSLPLPQGGRDAITKDMILREDQLPHKLLYPKAKKKTNKQDQDFLCSDDIFTHCGEKRAPLKPPVRKALAVFSGKRNPNDNHFSRSKH